MKSSISTSLTETFKISHPIVLAGMNVVASPALAAAVTNAGGLGVLGAIFYRPPVLRSQIRALKAQLHDPSAAWGVDIAVVKTEGNARKTNYDYTYGKLDEMIDIVIEEGAKLLVTALGCPPKRIVDKLHAAGIIVMDVVGHPKHVLKALENGVDMICAQGSEGGGHTGLVPTSILVPTVVKICERHTSVLTGRPVMVLAAGGIFDGTGLAAALMWGAAGVWVGTRFVCAKESAAHPQHQAAITTAGFEDTIRTEIFTGRPCRVRNSAWIQDWETNRKHEMQDLMRQGIIPAIHELQKRGGDKAKSITSEMIVSIEAGTRLPVKEGEEGELAPETRPWLMGVTAAVIDEVRPAREIVDEMVAVASQRLRRAGMMLDRPKAML